MQRNTYVFKAGYYEKTAQPRQVNYTQIQPEYSHFHNCTAILMDQHMLFYQWITVPCDKKFQATFSCQEIISSSVSGHAIVDTNVTCNANWLLLKGTGKCFSVLESHEQEMSFHDSQYMCSLYNASLFKVHVSDRNDTPYSQATKRLISALQAALYDNIPMTQTVQNMSPATILDFLFGRRLDMSLVPSLLPYFLQHEYIHRIHDQPERMSFFADFNHSCSIVESSDVSSGFAAYGDDTWGVKCRNCDERIQVSGIICEKPGEQHVMCGMNYFVCRDDTCILNIYKCDQIVDCFDNSDETSCTNNTYITLMNQFVNLPCIPSSDCDIDIRSLVPVQDICDGLYMNGSIPHEKDVCMLQKKHKAVVHSPISGKFVIKEVISGVDSLLSLFWDEQKYGCSKPNDAFYIRYNNTNAHHSFPGGRRLMESTRLNDVCIANRRKWRAYSSNSRFICSHIFCPGMFKCVDQYCISLSSVCDNITDCDTSEDEMVCSTLICPGSLKCRGENRCISREEICDEHVNCLYSMDDELGCATCPVNCECTGYVMSCYSNQSDPIVQSSEIMHIKGLVIRGEQRVLITNQLTLQLTDLIYLNISHCNLNTLDTSYNYTTHLIFIIIVDVSHNQLTDTNFIESDIFQRIVFLDISFNLLNVFQYRRTLRYLSALYLIGNNLKEIEMRIDSGNLALIDLQVMFYKPKLAIVIKHYSNDRLAVRVTDTRLCCMISAHIKCLSKQKMMTCLGIIQTFNTRVAFYCSSLLSLCISVGVSLKQILQMLLSKYVGKNKKYYWILLTNQLIDNILISLYLVSLSLADLTKVKLLFFKTSMTCIMLNAILYISLQTSIVFKCVLSGLITLKTMFPFKHQCPWIKWIGPASVCVWLFAITTYLIYIFLSFREENVPVFDKLCSIGWCDMEEISFNLLHGILYIISTLSILFFVVSFVMLYKSLKKFQSGFKTDTPTKHFTANIVTCKCILFNISEILLRGYLITILSMKVADLTFVHFCFYYFLYGLSVNILLSSLIILFQ